MASGYGVPVRFTKEKNVWDLFGIYNVGSGGALNVAQNINGQFINKGIANVWQNTPTFTGVTSSGSATISSISSFLGIFTGMALLNSNLPAGMTVGTISASTGSIVMNGASGPTGFTGSAGALMTVSGGQYIIQFGVQSTVGSLSSNARLDTYNRLLDFNMVYDSSTSSSIGTATQSQIAPTTSEYFIVKDNTTVKTIPAVATSSSTDACLIVQFGNNAGPLGNVFIPAVPAAGTNIRVGFTFGNTTAP